MSKVLFPCSSCGKRLSAPSDKVGRRSLCPSCRASVIVPNPMAGRIDDVPVGVPIAEAEDLHQDFYQKEKIRSVHAAFSLNMAVLVEVFGAFFQCFGIGHMVSGNILIGFVLLLGYWMILFLLLVVGFFCIGLGWIAVPFVWVICVVMSAVSLRGQWFHARR